MEKQNTKLNWERSLFSTYPPPTPDPHSWGMVWSRKRVFPALSSPGEVNQLTNGISLLSRMDRAAEAGQPERWRWSRLPIAGSLSLSTSSSSLDVGATQS